MISPAAVFLISALTVCLVVSLLANCYLWIKYKAEHEEHLADEISLNLYRRSCHEATKSINQLIKTRAFFRD